MAQQSPREIEEIFTISGAPQVPDAGKSKSLQWRMRKSMLKFKRRAKQFAKWFKSNGIFPLILSLWAALSLAMIIVGYIYVGECPVVPGFPVCIIIGGIIATLMGMGLFAGYILSECKKVMIPLSMVLFVCATFFLLVVWAVVGATVLHRVEINWSHDSVSKLYCNPALYRFGVFCVVIISCLVFPIVFVLKSE